MNLLDASFDALMEHHDGMSAGDLHTNELHLDALNSQN